MEDNRRIHFSSYSLNIYQFEEKTHSGCLNWVIVKQQRVQRMIINKPSCHVHLLFVFASPLPHYSKIYLICNLSASSTFFSPFPSPPKLTEHITGSPKIAVLQSQFIFFFSFRIPVSPSLPPRLSLFRASSGGKMTYGGGGFVSSFISWEPACRSLPSGLSGWGFHDCGSVASDLGGPCENEWMVIVDGWLRAAWTSPAGGSLISMAGENAREASGGEKPQADGWVRNT